jgi:flagellar biosynthesis/type III secretory pathway protein FliH/FixJ family two-component response regulator
MGTSASLPALAPASSSSGSQKMHGSILVVDDDEMIRNLFIELFRSEGVAIRVAGTAQDALSLVKQAPPALLMVDVTLPDLDGIQLLEQVQQCDQRVIGVVMTGSPSVELAVRAMKSGATEFLMKPIQNDVVLMTARRLLELHALRAENTVLKHAVVRAGGLRVQSMVLQTFGEDGVTRGQDGLTEYERGVAEGEQRACARDEECRRHERTVLSNAVRKFDQAWLALHQTVEEEVVSLAFQIATKVLHDRADQVKEQVVAQAKTALAALKESGRVTITVHPADAGTLDALRGELSQVGDLTLSLHIEPDITLSRGGCIVQTVNRVVDASLDTQLTRLGEALRARGTHVAQ